jgi:hypothetical protein
MSLPEKLIFFSMTLNHEIVDFSDSMMESDRNGRETMRYATRNGGAFATMMAL